MAMNISRCAMSLLLGAAVVGCTQNPFRPTASTTPISLTPPAAVAVPAHTLPQSSASLQPSYADPDPRQFEATLVRSRQETQLVQDEVAALREQLASTTAQLAQARTANAQAGLAQAGVNQQVGMPVGQPVASSTATGGLSPVEMQLAMAQIALPGMNPRMDGSVVRIDIPADSLFETGSAGLLPGGAAILTQVAAEVQRVYPGHFIGIEGHTDTEPLQNASWGTPHQLSVARASTVFDFFTTRTPMRQGQLFLVAHGSNHPVVSNATAAGRARNRRIELVIYPERSSGAADPAPVLPASG